MHLQEEMRIVSQHKLAPAIFEMKLAGKLVKEMKQAGQFLHLRVPCPDLLLRRPISLAEIDLKLSTCTIIYRVEGCGTEYFSKMKQGDTLDILAPLGNGFDISVVKPGKSALIIGGGIGVPPLYELSKKLITKSVKVVHLFGFATKEVIFYEEKFRVLGEVRISTDDGSYGVHGHVGDLLEKLEAENFTPDAVYACGASGMLKMVDKKFAMHPYAFISLESRMACGVGACYACVCHKNRDPTGTKSCKVCDQGPVFKTGEVVI
ncbi:MAG: dihydroorotate dehydrogenase electron transfer subunit [Streptococcaceae bacterium]|jgi:dihydroorotate dehydrogenase electron transfer subunit|nr:dihydroorotate dehydrogenase electron transfer subunit [Streptococcaceae bacterium]